MPLDREFCSRCKLNVGRACGTDESEKDCPFAKRRKAIRQDAAEDERINLPR